MTHVISADWYQGFNLLGDDGPIRWHGDIDWHVSEQRVCVGAWTPHGHRPCPFQNEVTHDRICGSCAPPWSDCVFEPIEHERACALCDRQHVVYVAFYGTLAKVGMTSANRVETRLTEQGADAWFIAQRRPNRLRARETERTISMLHGIPERRRTREYLRGWQQPPEQEAIARRADSLQHKLGERFDVEALHFNDHGLPTLPGAPAVVEAAGHHAGTVLGVKGRYLLYHAAEASLDVGSRPVCALPLGDLVGRYLRRR